MNLLFIEDDKLQRMRLQKAMSKVGASHNSKVMDNAREAIDLIRARVFLPDMIVVDFDMPVMNGLAFIKEMKRSIDDHIPIVVLTTSEDKHDILSSYKSGVAGYILKSTDYSQYIKTLTGLITYWESNILPEVSE